MALIEETFESAGVAVEIDYSVKTNYELGILERIVATGCGASIGAELELKLARLAGFAPERSCLDGPAKTDALLDEALSWGVRSINVDSRDELDRLAKVAAGRAFRAVLRMQVSPGWRGGVAEVASGRFGIPERDLPGAVEHARGLGIEPAGLAVHLGSQLSSGAPHARWLARAGKLLGLLRGPRVELNIGGGLPAPGLRRGLLRWLPWASAPPGPDLSAFLAPVADAAARLRHRHDGPIDIVAEPGRAIIGPAAWLIGRVVARKGSWTFLDAGRSLLPESLLFASRPIDLLDATGRAETTTNLAGPGLSSSDVLGLGVRMPETQVGDIVRLGEAGAYSLSRLSRFGTWGPPAFLHCLDGRVTQLRRRDTMDDLLGPMRP